MTSKIKVDNINKVSDDSNIIKKCGTTTTIGSGASNPIVVDGSAVTIGRCGGTVALASGATQTGFGRTGTVDWQTGDIKTTGFTAVNGQGFFVNTTSGGITVTLPSSPSAGNIVAIADYAGTAANNNITINRNGSPLEGATENGAITVNRQTGTFIYVDGTQGWIVVNSNDSSFKAPAYVTASGGTESTSGNFKIHTFTGPGNFIVSCAGNNVGSDSIETLIVAGGAGGGRGCSHGGGGGAGGLRNPCSTPVSAQTYPVVVGGGGAGAPGSPKIGSSGSVSSIAGISSAGGGGGGGWNDSSGADGGSGGGAACSPNPSNFGSGNIPNVSPPQGNPGGTSSPSRMGGGGGAGANGTAGTSGGCGGVGLGNSITGSPVFYAGGGGAGGSQPGARSSGGNGGGGAGGGPSGPENPGVAGTANTGGGGGGSFSSQNGAAGGSGVVIVKYKFQN
jgi:hypothetical protein